MTHGLIRHLEVSLGKGVALIWNLCFPMDEKGQTGGRSKYIMFGVPCKIMSKNS